MRLSKVIVKPIMTEKSYDLVSQDKYIFSVDRKATKNAIAQDVERLFGVDVISVNTSIMPGKKKRVLRSRAFTKTPKWKKAVVQIKSGQHIDFIEKEND